MEITLGSLFDGAGTVPFAAKYYGIKTLWSSEIEKFPLQVTAKHFPETKQLGDITKIKGDEIAPVDIIAFGSPCQDLSVAGKQKGLQGERSGLFMEAVRIIKEMRKKTNGIYPTFAIWENVPGAFSSNKGEDFRIVLEELCKIKDSSAVIPRPPQRGGRSAWNDSGEILADEYSIAWRVLDAQYWGVPQRRRRIFLVADFRGGRAAEILFKRNGLSGSFKESRESWQGITKTLAFGINNSGELFSRGNGGTSEKVVGGVKPVDNHPNDSRIGFLDGEASQTLTQRMGTGGGNVPLLFCYRKKGHPQNSEQGQGYEKTESADTLNVFDNTEKRSPVVVVVVDTDLKDENGNPALTCGIDIYNAAETGGVSKCLCTQTSDCDKVPCVVLALDRAALNQGDNAKYDFSIEDNLAQTIVARGAGGVLSAAYVPQTTKESGINT